MPERMHASTMAMSKKDWASTHSKELTIVRANWDGSSGDVVAVVWSDEDDADEMAIAQRFAAADDMLAALKEVRDRFFPADQPRADRDLQWAAVNDAIAKAEGR